MTAGDRFGDYTVIRLLGRGGMGEVWLLRSDTGNFVAAKILEATDHESRRRFTREAELALGVRHPNLVETYDVGEDPDTGLCYILMEYVSGGTLADYIKAHGALAIEDAVAVVEAMASVLELGRQKGIVHRDIKPANIMFASDGTPKLADLGIARGGSAGTETTMTQTGVMIGTPAYMAPEQMLDAHHVDTRADIYSLGVVFFEMLTGERPNKDDTIVQLMARAVRGEPLPDVRTLRPEVSASLAQLLNMMVVPDKDGRISTPGQITNALAIIERGGELDPSKARGKRRGRRKFVAAVACLALLGLAVAGTIAYCFRPEKPPVEKPPVESVPVEKPPVENAPALDGVSIEVSPSCASCAVTVTNWTVEAIRELKRQVGAAYEEKLAHVDNRICVCSKDEAPKAEWFWREKFFAELFKFSRPKRTVGICIVPGWSGFPMESAHGEFIIKVAEMASGMQYDLAQAESKPIAWGLKDALGLSVARRLGHGAAADQYLTWLRDRAVNGVAKARGVQLDDVTLAAKLLPNVKELHPEARTDYTWIVEYRVVKLFDDLMRENADIMHDYFALRNEYRRKRGGAVRIDEQTFAELLGKLTGRDLYAQLVVEKTDVVGTDDFTEWTREAKYNLRWMDRVSTDRHSKLRICIDVSHGGYGSYCAQREMNDYYLFDAPERADFVSCWYDLTKDDLADVNVLWIDETVLDFSAKEIDVLDRFMNDGGAVFLFCHSGQAASVRLLEHYGMTVGTVSGGDAGSSDFCGTLSSLRDVHPRVDVSRSLVRRRNSKVTMWEGWTPLLLSQRGTVAAASCKVFSGSSGRLFCLDRSILTNRQVDDNRKFLYALLSTAVNSTSRTLRKSTSSRRISDAPIVREAGPFKFLCGSNLLVHVEKSVALINSVMPFYLKAGGVYDEHRKKVPRFISPRLSGGYVFYVEDGVSGDDRVRTWGAPNAEFGNAVDELITVCNPPTCGLYGINVDALMIDVIACDMGRTTPEKLDEASRRCIEEGRKYDPNLDKIDFFEKIPRDGNGQPLGVAAASNLRSAKYGAALRDLLGTDMNKYRRFLVAWKRQKGEKDSGGAQKSALERLASALEEVSDKDVRAVLKKYRILK